MNKWILTIPVMALLLVFSGCDSGVLEGVAIGVGTSQAASEASQLAAEKKTALVAEILRLRADLESADPAEKEVLQAKLAELEKKQDRIELTQQITDQIKAGMERDWSEPGSPDNLAWILGSAATVLGGLAGKKTLDDRKKAQAIARAKIAAKPQGEKELYEALDAGA